MNIRDLLPVSVRAIYDEAAGRGCLNKLTHAFAGPFAPAEGETNAQFWTRVNAERAERERKAGRTATDTGAAGTQAAPGGTELAPRSTYATWAKQMARLRVVQNWPAPTQPEETASNVTAPAASGEKPRSTYATWAKQFPART